VITGIIQAIGNILPTAYAYLNGLGRIDQPFIGSQTKRRTVMKFGTLKLRPGVSVGIDVDNSQGFIVAFTQCLENGLGL